MLGSCQFGSSCHYKHINPDGTIGTDTTRSFIDKVWVLPFNELTLFFAKKETGQVTVAPACDNTRVINSIKFFFF